MIQLLVFHIHELNWKANAHVTGMDVLKLQDIWLKQMVL